MCWVIVSRPSSHFLTFLSLICEIHYSVLRIGPFIERSQVFSCLGLFHVICLCNLFTQTFIHSSSINLLIDHTPVCYKFLTVIVIWKRIVTLHRENLIIVPWALYLLNACKGCPSSKSGVENFWICKPHFCAITLGFHIFRMWIWDFHVDYHPLW